MSSVHAMFKTLTAALVVLFVVQLCTVGFVVSAARSGATGDAATNLFLSRRLIELAEAAQQVDRHAKEFLVSNSSSEHLKKANEDWFQAVEHVRLLVAEMRTHSMARFKAFELEEVAKWEEAAGRYQTLMMKAVAGAGEVRSGQRDKAELADLGLDRFPQLVMVGVSSMLATRNADAMRLVEANWQGVYLLSAFMTGCGLVGLICAVMLRNWVPIVIPLSTLGKPPLTPNGRVRRIDHGRFERVETLLTSDRHSPTNFLAMNLADAHVMSGTGLPRIVSDRIPAS